MKKIFSWSLNNLLFLCTILLLVVIPLYPKLPLLDIKNTWVYVRVEDFLVLAVTCIWLVYFIRKKITLHTPLTIPIFAFWIIGALATIHGIILIFPTTANIFPNVALLAYLRHIEYMSLFFISYAGMREKRFLPVVIATIAATLLGVILYGFGQKYLSFPAYLTMNEEFAKGIPIQLSSLSRVPSTFAGHYDLAAYLALMVPIMASLFFGFKNLLLKAFMVILVILGFILMFMTVSRISFMVLLVGIFIVLLFQKKKAVLVLLPVIAILGILLLGFKSSLLQRFGNTVKEVDVMVDGKTGTAIGNVSYVPAKYFFDKNVKIQRVEDTEALDRAIGGTLDAEGEVTTTGKVPFYLLLDPETQVPLVTASNVSTGESLPQGTGYINLSLSPVSKRVGNFFYGLSPDVTSTVSAQIVNFHGDFIIKKAAAYDLSFTTRFQGEWPHAIDAFERNIAIGSGYGSVSLAVDNNYLRMLGEIGLLGISAFLAIFLIVGMYIKKVLQSVESALARSFIVGYVAGVVALMLNAILIDVFEASKIAFLLWMLTGILLGTLHVYSKLRIDLYKEIKKAVSSPLTVIVSMVILIVSVFSRSLPNYFLGEDFTWFRYASTRIADTSVSVYGPATKLYFYLMYSVFWLNQDMYHLVSIFLHLVCAVLFFLIASKILKNKLLSALSAFLFLVLSGYSEAVLSISSTGYLFAAVFVLLGLLSYMYYVEKKKLWILFVSFVCASLAILFNEVGIVLPMLIVVYKVVNDDSRIIEVFRSAKTVLLVLPAILYIIIRFGIFLEFLSTVSLFTFPFTVINNLVGYFFLVLIGGMSEPLYRLLQGNMVLSAGFALVTGLLVFFVYKLKILQITKSEQKIAVFGILFFLVSLLPFIFIPGMHGTYIYLPTMGLLLFLMVCVNRAYTYLKTQGRDIAYASLAVLILVYCLLHIIQFQESLLAWRTNGEKVRNFYISIDDLYSNNWSQGAVDLVFVNIPAEEKGAQVLPSTLNNVLWFAFRNPNLKTKSYTNTNQALQEAKATPFARVFQFNNNGSVTEIPVNRK